MEGEGVGELIGDHDPGDGWAPRWDEGRPSARECRQRGSQIGETVRVCLTHGNLQRSEKGVLLASEVVECRQEERPLAGAVLAPAEGSGAAEALPGNRG